MILTQHNLELSFVHDLQTNLIRKISYRIHEFQKLTEIIKTVNTGTL